MIKFKTSDGAEITATDSMDAIHQLRFSSLSPAESELAWMREVSERTKGVHWDKGADRFINDLATAGFISIMEIK